MNPFRQIPHFEAAIYTTLSLFALLFITGCSSSDSSTPPASNITEVTASLGTDVKNKQLAAGVPTQIKFSYTIPGDITASGDYTVNFTKTLENMTLSSAPIASNGSRFETLRLLAYALIKDAFAAEAAQITAYISYAGDPNVCSSPYVFGPYSIMGTVGAALTSDTTTVEPGQAAVDIANAGSFDICVVTIPPIDAYITVTGVEMDIENCAPATADIIGNWTGTYSCDNFGTPDEPSTPISLDITRNSDGSYHYIDDGNAEYDGHLCGNLYRHKGGLAGIYSESGSMVFDGNKATKTSNWINDAGTAGGRCMDDLQKT